MQWKKFDNEYEYVKAPKIKITQENFLGSPENTIHKMPSSSLPENVLLILIGCMKYVPSAQSYVSSQGVESTPFNA